MEVWVLGVVAQRLHLYLLMTFDHRRGIPELHGRKWPTSFQALGRSLFAARTGANKYFVLDNSESETTVRKRKPQIAIRWGDSTSNRVLRQRLPEEEECSSDKTPLSVIIFGDVLLIVIPSKCSRVPETRSGTIRTIPTAIKENAKESCLSSNRANRKGSYWKVPASQTHRWQGLAFTLW